MKKKILSLIISVYIVSLLPEGTCNAQLPEIRRDSVYSDILQETRPLNIVLPKDFNASSPDKYELLFCLDGISDFLRMELDFLKGEGFVPKNLIMIGIPNTEHNGVDMRNRDFTPTHTSSVSGGADKFLSFFRNELIPFFITRYNAKPGGHTVYGGSLGGLFVMYAFLTDPGLFTSYIAIDPSLWWDNGSLSKLASRRLVSYSNLNNTLMIAGRQGNYFRYMGIAEMDSILHEKAPAGLDWQCIQYSDETHYSTNFKGFWDGLKFSYGGFYASTGGYTASRKIALKPMRGIVLKGVPFRLICYNLQADRYLHYTTDGSEPMLTSPVLAGEETPITLLANSKIKVKSFSVREEYNRTGTVAFETGTVFPADPKPAGLKPGGLNYLYYKDEWDKLSDVKKLKPVQTGFADSTFDVNTFSGENSFACLMTGYIEITYPGYYIFEMGNGNDFSKVYLGDRLLLGNQFVAGEGESFMVPLEKGFYPIRIEYFYKKDGGELEPIYLKSEGKDDIPIPSGMLFSNH